MSDRPLLEFPCDYTIKVLGRSGKGLAELVTATVERAGAELRGGPDLRDSRRGRFVAVNLTFRATSMEQLHAIHHDLRADPRVSLIL